MILQVGKKSLYLVQHSASANLNFASLGSWLVATSCVVPAGYAKLFYVFFWFLLKHRSPSSNTGTANIIPHMLHGTGISTYICHKYMVNVGKIFQSHEAALASKKSIINDSTTQWPTQSRPSSFLLGPALIGMPLEASSTDVLPVKFPPGCCLPAGWEIKHDAIPGSQQICIFFKEKQPTNRGGWPDNKKHPVEWWFNSWPFFITIVRSKWRFHLPKWSCELTSRLNCQARFSGENLPRILPGGWWVGGGGGWHAPSFCLEVVVNNFLYKWTSKHNQNIILHFLWGRFLLTPFPTPKLQDPTRIYPECSLELILFWEAPSWVNDLPDLPFRWDTFDRFRNLKKPTTCSKTPVNNGTNLLNLSLNWWVGLISDLSTVSYFPGNKMTFPTFNPIDDILGNPDSSISTKAAHRSWPWHLFLQRGGQWQ